MMGRLLGILPLSRSHPRSIFIPTLSSRSPPHPFSIPLLSRPALTSPELFMWSDDTEDADGASVSFGEGIYDGVIRDYPKPHLVLDHSTIETSRWPPCTSLILAPS